MSDFTENPELDGDDVELTEYTSESVGPIGADGTLSLIHI